jgi:hypothetical protein
MNQCWISGPLVENANVFSETAIRFIVRADIRRIGQDIEVKVPCHLDMVVEEMADYLVSEGKGTVVEFCGEIFEESGNLLILVDTSSFRLARISANSRVFIE